MKKTRIVLTAVMIAACMLVMAACGSSFGMWSEESKVVTIDAEKANEGSTYTSDTIRVDEGEGIVMTSEVEVGEISVEVFQGTHDEISDDEEEPAGEPVMTMNAGKGDAVSGTVPAGDYFVRATVTEKATGSVRVEVKPAN